MTTAWALTAQEICEDAAMHLGIITPGDMPKAADMNILLRALNAILKELPLAGYSWPKLSAETTLAWVSGATIALPSDFFGYLSVWRTDASTGKKVPFEQEIPHGRWITMLDRSANGTPTRFYVSPDNVLNLSPVPLVDPGIYIQYQKIVDDADVTATPNLPQFWLGALGFGVAHETSLKLARDKPTLRLEIEARWKEKRADALAYSVPGDNCSMTVAD